MKIGIYAILDNKAEMLIGGLQLHKAQASAIRSFTDIALDPKTLINRHPEDFELIELGFLTDNNTIHPNDDYNVVITGAAWAAAMKERVEE